MLRLAPPVLNTEIVAGRRDKLDTFCFSKINDFPHRETANNDLPGSDWEETARTPHVIVYISSFSLNFGHTRTHSQMTNPGREECSCKTAMLDSMVFECDTMSAVCKENVHTDLFCKIKVLDTKLCQMFYLFRKLKTGAAYFLQLSNIFWMRFLHYQMGLIRKCSNRLDCIKPGVALCFLYNWKFLIETERRRLYLIRRPVQYQYFTLTFNYRKYKEKFDRFSDNPMTWNSNQKCMLAVRGLMMAQTKQHCIIINLICRTWWAALE